MIYIKTKKIQKQIEYDYASFNTIIDFMKWYSCKDREPIEMMNMFYLCVKNIDLGNFTFESWCNVGYYYIEFSTTKFPDYPKNFQLELKL
jgi:hypothetical protein